MKKISIVIPVYNEEKNIEKVLEMVKNAPVDNPKEIIIVDDGSTDSTREILKRISDKNLKIVFQGKNQGKGMAIRSGLKEATGDIVLIQDADLEYSVNDYPKIISVFEKENADVVYGSRFKGKITGMHWPNLLANKILTWSANILYNIRISDEATAYKAFSKKAITSISLKCERFEFCPEVTAKMAKRGYKFFEVPIIYHGRNALAGKKIKLRDAFEAFWTLLKYRFKE